MTVTDPSPRAPDRLRAALERGGPALLALVLASSAWLAGLHGVDLAAQTYLADVVRLHGFVVWDNGWYGGILPLSYTVLSPVLSAVFGVGVVLVGAAVVATWCFDAVVTTVFGRRTLGSWYFAVSTLLSVTIGQVPYLTGEAAALAAVLCLLRGRRVGAVAFGIVSALLSPLAAAFLVMVCLVWAVHDGRRRTRAIVLAGGTAVAVGAISLLFPGDGPFPFAWPGLVVVELLCLTVLSPIVRTTKAVRLAAAIYGLASLASFIVPNPLGGNAARLAESFGIPLVACLVTAPGTWRFSPPTWVRRRPWLRGAHPRRAIGLLALTPFVVWQWGLGTGVVAAAGAPQANSAGFYQPLIAQLHRDDHGRDVRIEAVPTRDHWESVFLAPAASLARGWERQIDTEYNGIFYGQAVLTGASYRNWLLDNGVTYVALPDAPLDYAAKPEAALLRSGAVPGLALVWSSRDWTLWRVEGSPGLVSGPASLTRLAPDQLDVTMRRAGTATIRVHWTTYWQLAEGTACVSPAPGPDPWTVVHATRPGPVHLQASLLGSHPATCPSSD